MKTPDAEHRAYWPPSVSIVPVDAPQATSVEEGSTITCPGWEASFVTLTQHGPPPSVHSEYVDMLLVTSSWQVKPLYGTCENAGLEQETVPSATKYCTVVPAWGEVYVSLGPGMEQVPVPVLVPVPTIPESVATTGSVPSPQPEHKPTSRAARNTSPKISIRMTSPLGSENVFAMSLSPSCKQICHVPDEVSSF